jgi:hypothetical protein
MAEEPHQQLLNRDLSRTEVKLEYGEAVELLQDVAAYGSNLIPRCLASSDRKLADFVVLGALAKHAATMVDAVSVLVAEGAVTAAYVPARTLFETCLSILWVLKADTERRANLYFVWNLRQQRAWAQRSIAGTPENQAFSHVYSRFNLQASTASTKETQATNNQIAEIDKALADPEFASINAEFDKMKRKDHDASWHKPAINSIRKIAEDLQREPEYDTIYSTFSELVHGSRFSPHMRIERNNVSLTPIRGLRGIDTLLLMVLSYSFEIYIRLLKQYRPGEESNFSKKYVEDWQQRFMSIKRIKE